MNLEKYADSVERFWAADADWQDQVAHALLGLASESGEVLDIIKKAHYSPRKDVMKIVNREHLTEELGDILFYLVRVARLYGIPVAEIPMDNIAKLERRYEKNEAKSEEA